MKRFLVRLSVFAAIVSVIVLGLLRFAGGYVDYFYVKFTSPVQQSLILGDSRSFEGIRPDVLDENLDGKFPSVFNYSFTMGQAAYGDAYLESVKRKLDPATKNGLFILNVQPWLLAQRTSDNPKTGEYFEADLPPHNMRFVNMDPNIEYVFRNHSFFHFKAAFRRVTKTHENGWLEETNIPKDSLSRANLKKETIAQYEGFARDWKPSGYRLQKLQETIAFLEHYGEVVLVRMPVSEEIVSIEEKFWSGFSLQMRMISARKGAKFLDYSDSAKYRTFDGIHLEGETCREFTKDLGRDILNLGPR